MKRQYAVPLGRLNDWDHPAPERTAYKTSSDGFDAWCKVFTNRAFMLEACRKGDNGPGSNGYRPVVKP